jgi:hypothetical protein
VDELVVADVDAHVAEGAPQGVEEHQVARLQLALVDLLGGRRLLVRAAGQHEANSLFVDRLDEAAAVEAAAVDGTAASPIGHAQESHRGDHQLRGPVRHVVRALRDPLAHDVASLLQPVDQALVVHEAADVLLGRSRRGGMRAGGRQHDDEAEPAGHGRRG